MDKPKNLYLVESPGGRKLHVWAASGDQAKRIFCKEYGIRPGDYWCGVRSLTARKLKPEEVKAWEEQARRNGRHTFSFAECWRSARKPMPKGGALYERLPGVRFSN